MSGQIRAQRDKVAFKRVQRRNCQNKHEFHQCGTSLKFNHKVVDRCISIENDYCEQSQLPIYVLDPDLSPEQKSSNGIISHNKTDDFKYQEFMSSLVDHTFNCVATSKEFDIASSSNKEVKISLKCNSSIQSQNLSSLLGELEDECRSKYKIPDFSLMKLLERVCDRFSASNTNPSNELVLRNSKSSLNQNHFTKNRKKMATTVSKSLILDRMEAVMTKKYPVYLNDISRGEESIEIPIVNEKDEDLELPSFLYINKNMVHKDAHVDFSLARISDDNYCAQCEGDCLSSALPCECAAETRGEFAYTMEGLVKEEFLEECIALSREPERKYFYYCEICPLQNDLHRRKKRKTKPCKGHLSRKFIKECWSKCGCSKKCRNRVVQHGIQVPLQVFATEEGKGWGVRSVKSMKKGTFVCEYIGEIVTNLELYDRNTERTEKQERHTYPVLLDADWGAERMLKDEEALCLDATEFGNVARFINHRCCDPNLIEIPVEVETPDHHYYHLAFFASKDIEPMEELTWDYGIEFDDKNHPIKAFNCRCGSKLCRDRIEKSYQVCI